MYFTAGTYTTISKNTGQMMICNSRSTGNADNIPVSFFHMHIAHAVNKMDTAMSRSIFKISVEIAIPTNIIGVAAASIPAHS